MLSTMDMLPKSRYSWIIVRSSMVLMTGKTQYLLKHLTQAASNDEVSL